MTGAGERPEPLLGVAYVRFSTDRRSMVEDQQCVFVAITGRAGVQLAESVDDEAQSRSRVDRGDLSAMLQYLTANRAVLYILVNELEQPTGDLRHRGAHGDPRHRLDVTLLTEGGAVDPSSTTMALAKANGTWRGKQPKVSPAQIAPGCVSLRPQAHRGRAVQGRAVDGRPRGRTCRSDTAA